MTYPSTGVAQHANTFNGMLLALEDLYTAILALPQAQISGDVISDAKGFATTAPPSYSNSTENPLSLDLAGNLRIAAVDGADATQGAQADAAVAAGAVGSVSAKLRAISRDIVANIVLAAGANIIGKAGIDQTTPATTNGVVENAASQSGGIPSIARLVSAAGTTQDATNVKASAGRLYNIQGYNAAAAVRYLKLYNKATAPAVGTDTPVKTIALQPSAAFVIQWPMGLMFTTGIGFGLVTGSADNNSTSVTAADIVGLNLDYA